MGTWTIKYTMMFIIVAYSTIEIFSIIDCGFPPSKEIDFYIFLGFMVGCGLYVLIKRYFIMTIDKLNKIQDDTWLCYKMVKTNDNKFLHKLYVKADDWFSYIWYEIDYPFVLSKNSTVAKANFFIRKHPNAKSLKDWMNKKITKEKCQEEKSCEKTDFWTLFFVYCCALILIILSVALLENF